jgi:hypothetical protein
VMIMHGHHAMMALRITFHTYGVVCSVRLYAVCVWLPS